MGKNLSSSMIDDDDGNLLFAADPLYGGTMALSYNSRNQLLSAAVGGVSGSFTYDAEGHRQSATHAGQTSTFTVNPAAELSQVLVRQVEGGQRTWAVYGLGLLYEVEIESVSEPVYTLVGGDIMTLVSQVTERLRVHHYDQTGNTVAISDGQGRDVLWVQYDAYGAVVHAESPTQADGGAPVRPEVNALPDGLQRALAVTPWLYVGEHGVMTDPTGLLHMRARYYHPGLTRFLNADPIQFEGGMNWYGYAIGDPVMMVDPSGEIGLLGAVIGAAVGLAVQGAVDLYRGERSSWQDYAASAAGGAVAGATAGLGVGAIGIVGSGSMAGAAGGLASGLVRQTGNAMSGGSFDGRSVASEVVVGGVFGGAGTAIARSVVGRYTGAMYNQAKEAIGVRLARMDLRLRGYSFRPVVKKDWVPTPVTRTGRGGNGRWEPDLVARRGGRETLIEVKTFGSRVMPNQRYGMAHSNSRLIRYDGDWFTATPGAVFGSSSATIHCNR
jgi:RHS repeat-associated protein